MGTDDRERRVAMRKRWQHDAARTRGPEDHLDGCERARLRDVDEAELEFGTREEPSSFCAWGTRRDLE